MADLSSLIAQFGQGAGSTIASGVNRGLERSRQNRLYEIARQDKAEQQQAQAQQQKRQEEQAFFKDRIAALAGSTPDQRPQMWQGILGEAQNRGYDTTGEPEVWSDDLLPSLMGIAGVSPPGAGNTPASLQEFQAMTEGMSDEDRLRARRIELGLDPRASSAGAKVVTVEDGQGRKRPMLQFADGTVADFPGGKNYITRAPEDEKAAVTKAQIEAKREAEGEADLPAFEAEVNESVALVNKALNHPGLERAVGKSSIIPIMPGTEAANFTVLLEQIQGKNFLNAFEALKGAGQITEVEGRKAQEAFARLNTAQTEDAFKESLMELRQILQDGLRRKRGTYGGDIVRDAAERKADAQQTQTVNWSDL